MHVPQPTWLKPGGPAQGVASACAEALVKTKI
jgi:hypothetical protein